MRIGYSTECLLTSPLQSQFSVSLKLHIPCLERISKLTPVGMHSSVHLVNEVFLLRAKHLVQSGGCLSAVFEFSAGLRAPFLTLSPNLTLPPWPNLTSWQQSKFYKIQIQLYLFFCLNNFNGFLKPIGKQSKSLEQLKNVFTCGSDFQPHLCYFHPKTCLTELLTVLQRCFNAMPLNMLPFLSGISFPTLSHPAKSYSCFKYLLRDYSAFSYFCLFSRWRYLSLLFSHKLDVTLLLHLRHHIVTFLHIFLMKQEILFS